jgi:Mrp family chromosome partitioning ATPase
MTDIAKGLAAVTPAAALFDEQGVVAPKAPPPIIESLADPQSPVGEELRLLRANLQAIRKTRPPGQPLTCIAVVSALPGEGKSTISLGLGAALAREPGRRILVVEGDLRRPALSSSLGLDLHAGLSEWLQGRIERVPLWRVDPGGFFLLGAGRTPLVRPEDLGSPRMAALLQAARERFDFVILDATPILPVSDAVILQELVDGFLLVVRARATPRAAINDALGRIRADMIVGLVLNDQREYRRSYMAYAYDRYNMYGGVAEVPSSRSSTREGHRRRGKGR